MLPEILEKNKLFIKIDVGSVTISKENQNIKAELFTTLHGEPCIQFNDGTTVFWKWEELINQALEKQKARN